ncbi:MAG: hypothetical protein AAF211_17710 [Myxococcota bacterium]
MMLLRATTWGLFALLPACVNTVRFPPDLIEDFTTFDSGLVFVPTVPTVPTGDSGTPEPPSTSVVLDRVWSTCADGVLTVQAITDGWSTELLLDVLHADGRAETWPLEIVAVDPEGEWDQWRVALTQASDPGPGSSVFDCEAEASALTYALRLRTEAEPLSDCGVWGVNPNQMDLWLTQNEPAHAGPCRPLEP